MPLGDFLVAYLAKIGVTHLFGIPGDLVIRLFFRFGRGRAFRIVTLCHDPGVRLAADGYAHASGARAVHTVTYGAGRQHLLHQEAVALYDARPVPLLTGRHG